MTQNDFWNKLKKRLRDVSSAAADFTEEQALIGKLKFDILTLKRKIDRKQREIGEKVYGMSSKSPKPDPFRNSEIKQLIVEIAELELQVEAKRASITEVADQVRSKDVPVETAPAPKPKKPARKKPPAKKTAKPKTTAKKATTNKKPAAKKTTAKKSSTKSSSTKKS